MSQKQLRWICRVIFRQIQRSILFVIYVLSALLYEGIPGISVDAQYHIDEPCGQHIHGQSAIRLAGSGKLKCFLYG